MQFNVNSGFLYLLAILVIIFVLAQSVVYISKNWRLSIAPLVFMVCIFLAIPSLASSVGVLVPVGVLIALGAGRILYKKGWI